MTNSKAKICKYLANLTALLVFLALLIGGFTGKKNMNNLFIHGSY